MAPKKKRQPTWSEVAYSNAGAKDALKAMEFALNWGMATIVLEREPESIDEFAEVMEISRATAFRFQQAFRKAFPMLEGPADFNDRAGLGETYKEVKTLALEPVNFRPFVFAKLFMVGAMKANLPES